MEPVYNISLPTNTSPMRPMYIRSLSINIHAYENSIATHGTPLILVRIMPSIMW